MSLSPAFSGESTSPTVRWCTRCSHSVVPELTYSVRVNAVGTWRVYCNQVNSWYGRRANRCSAAHSTPPLSGYSERTTALLRPDTVWTTRSGMRPSLICMTSYR